MGGSLSKGLSSHWLGITRASDLPVPSWAVVGFRELFFMFRLLGVTRANGLPAFLAVILEAFFFPCVLCWIFFDTNPQWDAFFFCSYAAPNKSPLTTSTSNNVFLWARYRVTRGSIDSSRRHASVVVKEGGCIITSSSQHRHNIIPPTYVALIGSCERAYC